MIRVVALLLTLACAWAAGFLWFVAVAVPESVEDDSTRTDAIVVLTGGRERVNTGLALLQSDMAGQLFVSGVPRGVDLADILRHAGPGQHARSDQVVLGHAAEDTVGNAIETAGWAAGRRISSVRLVTGAYHMPRALLEFRRALPDAMIVPHPVFPDSVKSREWWRWPGTALLLATEYAKYGAAIVRHWFLPRKALP
ncbi:conserved hypothetical protein [Magnetospirillum sp. LM-5]|uniref:YdcF family protein n=1 Tax=Magnetospirillum sp. LM-5 TaxID=2681466 RepID=UPI001380D99C|nr:YdcF family protein [Magnetospirillum sp. LM-5]CAA7621532.1 conserved hypothetical protein [Magnetospirillum sp. LM-5]